MVRHKEECSNPHTELITDKATGDGEISFGGRQDVSNLMNALEGAAVNAAGQRANANGAAAPETPAAQPPAAVANAADPSLQEQVSLGPYLRFTYMQGGILGWVRETFHGIETLTQGAGYRHSRLPPSKV